MITSLSAKVLDTLITVVDVNHQQYHWNVDTKIYYIDKDLKINSYFARADHNFIVPESFYDDINLNKDMLLIDLLNHSCKENNAIYNDFDSFHVDLISRKKYLDRPIALLNENCNDKDVINYNYPKKVYSDLINPNHVFYLAEKTFLGYLTICSTNFQSTMFVTDFCSKLNID